MPVLRIIGDDWPKETKANLSFDPNKPIKDYRPKLMKSLGITNIRDFSFWHVAEDGESPDLDRDPLNVEWKWGDYGFKPDMYFYVRRTQPGDRVCDPNAKPSPPKPPTPPLPPPLAEAEEAKAPDGPPPIVIFLIGDKWMKESGKVLSLRVDEPIADYFSKIAKKLSIELSVDTINTVGCWSLWQSSASNRTVDLEKGPIDPTKTWADYGITKKGSSVYLRVRKEGDRRVREEGEKSATVVTAGEDTSVVAPPPAANVGVAVVAPIAAADNEVAPPPPPTASQQKIAEPSAAAAAPSAVIPPPATVVVPPTPAAPADAVASPPPVSSVAATTVSVTPPLQAEAVVSPSAPALLPPTTTVAATTVAQHTPFADAPSPLPPPPPPSEYHERKGEEEAFQPHSFQPPPMAVMSVMGQPHQQQQQQQLYHAPFHPTRQMTMAVEEQQQQQQERLQYAAEAAALKDRIRQLEAQLVTAHARERAREEDDLARMAELGYPMPLAMQNAVPSPSYPLPTSSHSPRRALSSPQSRSIDPGLGNTFGHDADGYNGGRSPSPTAFSSMARGGYHYDLYGASPSAPPHNTFSSSSYYSTTAADAEVHAVQRLASLQEASLEDSLQRRRRQASAAVALFEMAHYRQLTRSLATPSILRQGE